MVAVPTASSLSWLKARAVDLNAISVPALPYSLLSRSQVSGARASKDSTGAGVSSTTGKDRGAAAGSEGSERSFSEPGGQSDVALESKMTLSDAQTSTTQEAHTGRVNEGESALRDPAGLHHYTHCKELGQLGLQLEEDPATQDAAALHRGEHPSDHSREPESADAPPGSAAEEGTHNSGAKGPNRDRTDGNAGSLEEQADVLQASSLGVDSSSPKGCQMPLSDSVDEMDQQTRESGFGGPEHSSPEVGGSTEGTPTSHSMCFFLGQGFTRLSFGASNRHAYAWTKPGPSRITLVEKAPWRA